MKLLEWIERELRTRYDLCALSLDQEKEARHLLVKEWIAANQLRFLEKARDQDMWPGRVSVVYFAQERSSGAIKIGTSTQVDKRIRTLEKMWRSEIALVATVAGAFRVEAWMHDRFKELHIGHEWFRPEPELLNYIEELRP